jgi:hypothetical protein
MGRRRADADGIIINRTRSLRVHSKPYLTSLNIKQIRFQLNQGQEVYRAESGRVLVR